MTLDESRRIAETYLAGHDEAASVRPETDDDQQTAPILRFSDPEAGARVIHAALDGLLVLSAKVKHQDAPKGKDFDYVPCGHGNGMRYDWKIERYDSLSHLLLKLAGNQAAGFRIGYICAIPRGGEFDPGFAVQWIRDDDSNFISGIDIVEMHDLDSEIELLRGLKRRPICLVHAGFATDIPGYFCVVWIQDNRYLGEKDWTIVSAKSGNLAEVIDPYSAENYRAIWATTCPYGTWVVMVKESFPVNGWIRVTETADASFDPVADLAEFFPEITPVCIELKLDTGLQTWTIVGVKDPDLDAPASWTWDPSAKNLPTKGKQTTLKTQKQRIFAFAPVFKTGGEVPESWLPEPRWTIVQGSAPAFVVRILEAEVDDPLPELARKDLEDTTVFNFVAMASSHSTTLAVQSKSGLRYAAGFTYGPLAMPDTRPETQFRIGSISKMFTTLTFWRTLVLGHPSLDGGVATPVFLVPELNGNTEPSVSADGYPELVNNTTFRSLITHTSGWRQDVFDPGARPRTVTKATGKSGAMFGWMSKSGIGLLPMVQRDYVRYQLDQTVFNNNDVDGPWFPLADRVGWRAMAFDPSNPGTSLYSGFAIDLLGAVLERMHGDVSGSRENFAGYTRIVRSLLLDGLGLSQGTLPGRSARGHAAEFEAVYPAAPYVELTGTGTVAGFSETFMFTPASDVPDEDWYDSDDLPDTLLVSPVYVTRQYGGLYGYVVDAVTPAGGWVSTAPDLCRFLAALDPDTGVFPPFLLQTMLSNQGLTPPDPTTGTQYTLSGFVPANGFVWFNGFAPGHLAYLEYAPSGRRFAYCAALSGADPGYAGMIRNSLDAFQI